MGKQPHKGPVGTIIFSLIILGLIIIFGTGQLDRWASLLPIEEPGVYYYPLIIIFFTVIIAKLVNILLHRTMEKARKHLKVSDRTRFTLLAQFSTLGIYLIGIGFAGSFIPALRNLSVSLFAGAGILAVVVGFATQKTLGNLVSGLMIAIYQPYRIGDRIRFGDEYGEVSDITLRHTVIKTWDNRRVVVPNSKMDEEVINNLTIEDPKMLGWLDIGISYDSDIDLARKIMVEEVHAHKDFLDNRTAAKVLENEEPVKARVVEHADSSIKLRLYYWAADQPTNWQMRTDLLERIKKRFDKEGVEIPFPYRTIVEKKHLARPKQLKAAARQQPGTARRKKKGM